MVASGAVDGIPTSPWALILYASIDFKKKKKKVDGIPGWMGKRPI